MVNKTYFTKYPFTQPPILVTTLLPPHPHNKPVRELRQVCTDEGSDSLPAQEANSSQAGRLLHSVCPRRPALSSACICQACTHTCACPHTLVQGSHEYTGTPTPVHAYSHTTHTLIHTQQSSLPLVPVGVSPATHVALYCLQSLPYTSALCTVVQQLMLLN